VIGIVLTPPRRVTVADQSTAQCRCATDSNQVCMRPGYVINPLCETSLP
jgi:hypothetical protein